MNLIHVFLRKKLQQILPQIFSPPFSYFVSF
jgi:hypothetical protein